MLPIRNRNFKDKRLYIVGDGKEVFRSLRTVEDCSGHLQCVYVS